MIILLKLISFAIWVIIMLFIIGAGLQRKRLPIRILGSSFAKGGNRSKYRRREKA